MRRSLLFSALLILVVAFSTTALVCERARRAASNDEHRLNEERRRAVAALETVRAQIKKADNPPPSASIAARLRSAKPAPQRFNITDVGALVREDPHLQALKAEAQAALIRTKYEPLFRQLHLSRQQIARLGTLVAEHEGQQHDISTALREQRLAIDGPEARKIWDLMPREYVTALRELLGDEGLRAWEQYERTMLIRKAASAFAGAATIRGAPMTSQQVEQLTNAMANASTAYQNGGHAITGDLDWATVLDSMATHLSPDQLAAVSGIEPRGFGGRHTIELRAVISRGVAADKKAGVTARAP